MLTDANRLLLRGLSLKQSREALALRVALPTLRLQRRRQFLRMSAQSFILNNPDTAISPEFDLDSRENQAACSRH